jgi:2TM domain
MSWNWGWSGSWGSRSRKSASDKFQPIEQAEDTRITPDMSPAEVELRIRRRIEKRHRERAEFISGLISYLITNVIVWAIFIAMSTGQFFSIQIYIFPPWPAFVTFFWGIGLARRGYNLYRNSPDIVARRETLIQQEVDQMKARMGFGGSFDSYNEKPKNTEKQKNDQPIRLTADGELIPADSDFAESDTDEAADETHWHNQFTDLRY